MKGEWIVPVVVLIVWLVSTILKSRENAEPVRPRQAGGGDGRKPTSDIDRFLQEIDRLKRKSAEERGETVRAAPKPKPKPVQPVPRVRPVVRPIRVEPVPQLVAVEPAPIVTAAAVSAPVSAYGSPPPTPAPPARAAQVSAVELRSAPGVAEALKLLRSPRSLAAAVVLQEVLGPPKSRR
jgi:hypothetical protein